MTAALVLGVIALVAAIVAWVTWQRGADERQSVQHHQHTLETLRHVADRPQQSVWPVSGRRGSASKGRPTPRPPPARQARRAGPPGTAPDHSVPDAGASLPGRGETGQSSTVIGSTKGRSARGGSAKESAKVEAGRHETMVFADDSVGFPAGSSGSGAPSSAPRPGGQPLLAAEQARRDARLRVRRTRVAAGAAVIAVAVAVGGVLAFGRSPGPSRSTARPSHPATTAGHGHPITTAPSTALAPTAPTAFSATYQAPSATYTVAIAASAQCWVMATQASTGKVVWTGTVAAGGTQSIPVSGSLVVELGAPSDASVSMDGRAVQLPTGYRAPFDLTFQAAP